MREDERLEQILADAGIRVFNKAVCGFKDLLVRKSNLSCVFIDPRASRHSRAAILAERKKHSSQGEAKKSNIFLGAKRPKMRWDALLCAFRKAKPEDSTKGYPIEL